MRVHANGGVSKRPPACLQEGGLRHHHRRHVPLEASGGLSPNKGGGAGAAHACASQGAQVDAYRAPAGCRLIGRGGVGLDSFV